MTNRDDLLTSDEAIETILRSAPPRPAPSATEIANARSAVREEWQALCGRRRTRRRLLSLAAAACAGGAIVAVVLFLRVPSALPETFATIERFVGTIYRLDEQSVLHELSDTATLSTGQTLVTGNDAAVALACLNGGSLRIDEDSRVEFVSPTEIFLHDGRVYFDTRPSAQQANGALSAATGFTIHTDEGLIHHIGTQYMAGVSASGLTVSVREGRVRVVGNTADATASAGQRVRLQGGTRPAYTSINTYGESWHWAEKITPEFIVDQRSAYEFIGWVARETGLELRYEDESTEQLAHATNMTGGSGGLEPRTALQVLLQITTLTADIEDGRILVRQR